MKILSYCLLFSMLTFSVSVDAQIACESGTELEICAPKIPPDTEVIQGFKSYADATLQCYWVCPGDTLYLSNAFQCNVFMEPKAVLQLVGNANFVWAKSECKVEILANAFNTTLGILEDVIFIDDGNNTMETICPNLAFNYVFAPEEGCDLTSVDPELKLASVEFYPNPVSGTSSILMSTQESYFGELYLSDSFGRVVKKWEIEGQPNIELPLENISPGVYLIHIPNTNLAKKIVVF